MIWVHILADGVVCPQAVQAVSLKHPHCICVLTPAKRFPKVSRRHVTLTLGWERVSLYRVGQHDYSSLVCFGMPLLLCFGGFHISSADWTQLDTRRSWHMVSRITPARHAHSVPGNSPPSPAALWVHSDTNCTHLRIWLSLLPLPQLLFAYKLYFCNWILNRDYNLISIMDLSYLVSSKATHGLHRISVIKDALNCKT